MRRPAYLPFVRARALLETSVRLLLVGWLSTTTVLVLLLAGAVLWGLAQSARLRDQPWIVTSVSGVQTVHPGTISDEAVAAYAWDKAHDLLNVSHDTVERRYAGLAPWLSEALQVHLNEALRAKGEQRGEVWAEAFSADRSRVTVQRLSSDGWRWEVTVPGTLTEYIGGFLVNERPEIVTLHIATQRIGPEQPNLLEVVEVWRRTHDEQLGYEQARQRTPPQEAP